MHSVSGFIVGLWFFPVMLNIVLPLVILGCWLVVLALSKLAGRATQHSMAPEFRQEKRIGKRRKDGRRVAGLCDSRGLSGPGQRR